MTLGRQHAVTVSAASAAVVAGAVVAVQLESNAMLSVALASAPAAAVAAFATGATAVGLAVVAIERSRPPTGKPDAPIRRSLEIWWLLGGITSAAYVVVSAAAAPVVGLTVLTLGLVAGQLVGSLLADTLGVSPQGRTRANGPRILSAIAGIVAIALGSGSDLDGRLADGRGLLVVGGIIAVGVCSSFGVAANGQLGVRLGDPLRAAFLTLVVALALSSAVAASTTLASNAGPPVTITDIPPAAWIGGLLGAVWVVASVRLVRRLGVLILLVGALTGQLLGSVALDIIAPVADEGVDPSRLAGVGMMAVALTLALAGSRSQPTPPSGEGAPEVSHKPTG